MTPEEIEERKTAAKRKATRRICAMHGIDVEKLCDNLIASWRSRGW